MSDEWAVSIKVGMYVRVVQSIEKELIGKLGIVKEVTVNSPRAVQRWKQPDDPFREVEVLVTFPDIPDRPSPTVMVQRGNQFGKTSSIQNMINRMNYEKIFRPEHIAPATMMDRLIYG